MQQEFYKGGLLLQCLSCNLRGSIVNISRILNRIAQIEKRIGRTAWNPKTMEIPSAAWAAWLAASAAWSGFAKPWQGDRFGVTSMIHHDTPMAVEDFPCSKHARQELLEGIGCTIC